MIVAVVLAAGGSRRLGRAKQLVMYHGETLVQRTARIVRAAQVARVGIVLGARAEDVWSSVAALPVERIDNTAWEEGMASSLRVGAAWASHQGASALLVCVCDQPQLTTDHLDALITSAGTTEIIGSAYRGAIGVPAIFPESSFAALKAMTGDRGARALLVDQRAIAWEPGAFDIDEPADVARLEP